MSGQATAHNGYFKRPSSCEFPKLEAVIVAGGGSTRRPAGSSYEGGGACDRRNGAVTHRAARSVVEPTTQKGRGAAIMGKGATRCPALVKMTAMAPGGRARSR